MRTGYNISNPDVYQAFGEARIECEKLRHKKTRHVAGFSLIGSGGRIDSDLPKVDPHPFGAHFVRPKRLRVLLTCFAEPNPASIAKTKMGPTGGPIFCFGSGGAFAGILDLYAEPFPLVA